jgi:hypothetical protein
LCRHRGVGKVGARRPNRAKNRGPCRLLSESGQESSGKLGRGADCATVATHRHRSTAFRALAGVGFGREFPLSPRDRQGPSALAGSAPQAGSARWDEWRGPVEPVGVPGEGPPPSAGGVARRSTSRRATRARRPSPPSTESVENRPSGTARARTPPQSPLRTGGSGSGRRSLHLAAPGLDGPRQRREGRAQDAGERGVRDYARLVDPVRGQPHPHRRLTDYIRVTGR